MVMGMLKKAVKIHGNAAKPLLHSDQGWHYPHATVPSGTGGLRNNAKYVEKRKLLR
jgi:transposase InsO family protein